MNSRQSTLLAETRPSRVAFLIDLGAYPPDSARLQALLVAIADLNKKQWGGRTHHVGFFTGAAMAEDEWRLLEWADPDYIIGCSPLPEHLVQALDDRIQPCGMEIQDQRQVELGQIALHNNWSVGVPPTKENLSRFALKPEMVAAQPSRLLVIGFGESCHLDIKRFVHFNFGTYDQWIEPTTKIVRRPAMLESMFVEANPLLFTVTDLGSLAATLTSVSGIIGSVDAKAPIPFFAPYQLSSIQLPDWPWTEFQHRYELIIGDSPKDFCEHWNGARWKGNWTATHTRQLWIPASFLADKSFTAALRHWVDRFRSWDNSWHLDCISHSLPEGQVKEFLALVNNSQYFRTTITSSDNADARRERIRQEKLKHQHFIPWQTNGEVPRLSASFNGDVLNLPMPEVIPSQGRSARWMVDVQLEHLSNHRNSGPDQCWWILPRTRSRWVTRAIFGKPSRINGGGRISVEVENIDEPYAHRVRPQLTVRGVSDFEAVQLIICPPRALTFPGSDPRSDMTREPLSVADCRVSDKGRYLAALLGQFNNFWTASNFCERRFWRTLFSDLAGHKPSDDEPLRKRIAERLAPRLAPTDANEQTRLAQELAGEFLHLVRGRLQGRFMTHQECQQLLHRLGREPQEDPLVYPQGTITVHNHGIKPLTMEDMGDGLDLLLGAGVLRLGVEKTCPRCTVSYWHHVNDLKQESTCNGCGHTFTLGAREEWSYSLNSLARMSVSQGVLGTLHALTAAASHARYFFAFAPSLELFKAGENSPWREIDVVYVIDGELVIGEVKEGFVQDKDFAELVEIALGVRPARAVMFMPLDRAEKQKVELQKWISTFGAQLRVAGVTLEIFTLPGF